MDNLIHHHKKEKRIKNSTNVSSKNKYMSFFSFFYLCDVLQPSSQRDEHKEHRWSVEECDGALAGSLSHGDNKDHAGVDVGDRGG